MCEQRKTEKTFVRITQEKEIWILYRILEINVTVERPVAGALIPEEPLFLLFQVFQVLI